MSIVDLANFLPVRKDAVDASQFKLAMRNLAGAVSVITLGKGPRRTGFTASSVTSFSAEPPVALVSLNRQSSSWPVLSDASSFAINVLTDAQSAVADRFAGRGGIQGNDRYVGWDWDELPSGTLGLKGALAVFDCDVEEIIERHSHALIFGRVRDVTLSDNGGPLLYWRGQYQQLPGNYDPFSN